MAKWGNGWRDVDPSKLGVRPEPPTIRPGVPATIPPRGGKRRSKYGAEPTVVDGIRFDSKKEAERWQELRLLEQAGEITDLQRQRKFPLVVKSIDGFPSFICFWIADFVYRDKQRRIVVEDAKGLRTKEYALKKKLFEALYGHDVVEV